MSNPGERDVVERRMSEGATTDDYRNACSGEGDLGSLGYDWSDKPHRLVYDLCGEVDALKAELERLRDGYMPALEFAIGYLGIDAGKADKLRSGALANVPSYREHVERLRAQPPSPSGDELVEVLAKKIAVARSEFYGAATSDLEDDDYAIATALQSHIRGLVDAGRAEEREACALIVEHFTGSLWDSDESRLALRILEGINSRTPALKEGE